MNISEFQTATLTSSTYTAKGMRSMKFKPNNPFTYRAGQHCDIRLTAADGYQAQRSYSIASAPSVEADGILEFGVQIIQDGEISSYLDQMEVGHQLEIKGPIGGHFVLPEPAELQQPLLLIGAGSGVVPLISMLREYANHIDAYDYPMTFISSHRKAKNIPWRTEIELLDGAAEKIETRLFITREMVNTDLMNPHRIGESDLQLAISKLKSVPLIYICGRNQFVEDISNILLDLSIPAAAIRTERYG